MGPHPLFLIDDCLKEIFLHLVEETPKNISSSGHEISNNTRHLSKKIYVNIPYIVTKNLMTCTLVSRRWCDISTPILYAYPFHKFRHIQRRCPDCPRERDEIFKPYYKLIRTLISCIPEKILEQLLTRYINNVCNQEFNLIFNKTKRPLSIDYFKFIHGLYFTEELFNSNSWYRYKNDWLPLYFPRYVSGTDLLLDVLIEESFILLIMKEFVKCLCENFNKISTLELYEYELHEELYYTMIESLMSIVSGSDGSSRLEELYGEDILQYAINASTNPGSDRSDITHLYKHLLPKMTNLTLFGNRVINSLEQANILSQIIFSQEKLQHIILSEGALTSFNNQYKVISGRYYNIILASLGHHKEWLVKLEFRNIHFGNLDQETINSLTSLENIKELKLIKCNNLEVELIPWAKSMNKLEIFEFEALDCPEPYIPEEFLKILLQNCSKTLTKLVLNRDQDPNILKIITVYINKLELIHPFIKFSNFIIYL